MLHKTTRFYNKYTEEQKRETLDYFNRQLAKVDVADLKEEERDYMMEMMLYMYANPLKNKLKTILGGLE